MWTYQAPVADLLYGTDQVLGAPASWAEMPAFVGLDAGTTREVVEQAARFAGEVLVEMRAAQRPADAAPAAADPIAWHPAMRRILLTLQARTDACRRLAYWCALRLDEMSSTPVLPAVRWSVAMCRCSHRWPRPCSPTWATAVPTRRCSCCRRHRCIGAGHRRPTRPCPSWQPDGARRQRKPQSGDPPRRHRTIRPKPTARANRPRCGCSWARWATCWVFTSPGPR